MVAVTNRHWNEWVKTGAIDYLPVLEVKFKTHLSPWANVKVWQGCALSGGAKGDFFLPCPISRCNLHLLDLGPFFPLQRSHLQSVSDFRHGYIHLPLSLLWAPVITKSSLWIAQDNGSPFQGQLISTLHSNQNVNSPWPNVQHIHSSGEQGTDIPIGNIGLFTTNTTESSIFILHLKKLELRQFKWIPIVCSTGGVKQKSS
jgi:hypothetical protein